MILAESGQKAEIFARSERSLNRTENAFDNERGHTLNLDKVGIITMSAKERSLKEKHEFHSERRCALISELIQLIT